jgi:hypothetical protein
MRFKSAIATVAAASGLLLMAAPGWAAVGGPVSSTPASWTPSIATSGTDGSVELIRQLVPCGNLMYAVGSFTQIKQGATTYTRNNVFSFNASTGAMTSWAPNITPGNVGVNGSGAVNSIALSANCATAYLGGVFTAVNGTKASNIAAVNASTGALITSFAHSSTGQVAALVRSGTHLLAGGFFTAINGSAKQYLASLNLTTGLDDGYVNLGISGNYQYRDAAGSASAANPTRVWNFSLSPNGTKLLATGDFTRVAGQGRQQVFMLDLGSTSATLDAWYSPEFNQFCTTNQPFYLQDAAWSPDQSKVYVATTGYKPATGTGYRASDPRAGLCDAAAAFSSSANSNLSHQWINYTGCDSLYSVAADNRAVYIAGHERWANNPNGCDNAGPGAIATDGLGALSPTNGLLVTNPTRDRGDGADDLVVTSAGLWIGSDNAFGSSACGKTSTGAAAYGHAGICFLPY